MATTTTSMNVELTYMDYAKRTYKIPYQSGQTTAAAKAAIANFNTAAQTDGSDVRQTFISENGAPVASINSATIVERTEDVIYSVQ